MRRRGPNEGSIFLRGDGRWVAEVHLGYRDGHRRRKQFYGSSRRAVAEKLVKATRDLQMGISLSDDRQPLSRFLDSWLEQTRPAVRPKTYASYASTVRLHISPELGRIAVGRLTPQHVQGLLNAKLASGLSARTVGIVYEVLRNALGKAVR